MSNLIQSTTKLAMHIAAPYIRPDATLVDATCGNGHDSLALAQALFADNAKADADTDAKADAGRLYAFDIQHQAVEATKTLLEGEGFGEQITKGSIRLICDSHENMDQHLDHADVIIFNLGYLPGGDKTLTTTAETTMTAIKDALLLLDAGGLICITMYSGHEAGAYEKAQLLQFAERLDSKQWHVAYINMINQANNPPEILLITRKLDK
ncbi:MAG: class I SAM-dependent methyltransferase [Bacillota bacterium]|nr:class I SAM-dependent methyltransferase [Bacillota bacterium]